MSINRKLGLEILFILVLLSSIGLAQTEKIITIDFQIFKNQTITNFSAEVGKGKVTPINKEGNYLIELRDKEGNSLYRNKLQIRFLILKFYGPPEKLNKSRIHLRIPYLEKTKEFRIYHKSQLLEKFDLANFICNENLICESNRGESNYLCPDECRKGEILPFKTTPFFWFLLLLGLGIVISSSYIVWKKK